MLSFRQFISEATYDNDTGQLASAVVTKHPYHHECALNGCPTCCHVEAIVHHIEKNRHGSDDTMHPMEPHMKAQLLGKDVKYALGRIQGGDANHIIRTYQDVLDSAATPPPIQRKGLLARFVPRLTHAKN